jgi:hypothetical protein
MRRGREVGWEGGGCGEQRDKLQGGTRGWWEAYMIPSYAPAPPVKSMSYSGGRGCVVCAHQPGLALARSVHRWRTAAGLLACLVQRPPSSEWLSKMAKLAHCCFAPPPPPPSPPVLWPCLPGAEGAFQRAVVQNGSLKDDDVLPFELAVLEVALREVRGLLWGWVVCVWGGGGWEGGLGG